MQIEPIYLAHSVVGSLREPTGELITDAERIAAIVKANKARAERWLAWLVYHLDDVAIRCSWIGYVGALPETPEMRARGLRDDDLEVATCTGIVLCGGFLSSGMARAQATILRSDREGYAEARALADLLDHQFLDGQLGCIPSCGRCSLEHLITTRPVPYVLDLLDLGAEPPTMSYNVARTLLHERRDAAREAARR